jgi:hypothetical protein
MFLYMNVLIGFVLMSVITWCFRSEKLQKCAYYICLVSPSASPHVTTRESFKEF